jgi:hypothetical protein
MWWVCWVVGGGYVERWMRWREIQYMVVVKVTERSQCSVEDREGKGGPILNEFGSMLQGDSDLYFMPSLPKTFVNEYSSIGRL